MNLEGKLNENGKPGLLSVSLNVQIEPNRDYTGPPDLSDIVTTIILPINSYLTVKGSIGPDRWRHYHEWSYNFNNEGDYEGDWELEGNYILQYSYGIEMHLPLYKLWGKLI